MCMFRFMLRRSMGFLHRLTCFSQQWRDIHCMQPFWPLNDFKTDRLAGFEGLVTFHLDGRKMGEQVVIRLAVFDYESITFCIVEPLDFSVKETLNN